jgi:hypothetical protein
VQRTRSKSWKKLNPQVPLIAIRPLINVKSANGEDSNLSLH